MCARVRNNLFRERTSTVCVQASKVGKETTISFLKHSMRRNLRKTDEFLFDPCLDVSRWIVIYTHTHTYARA